MRMFSIHKLLYKNTVCWGSSVAAILSEESCSLCFLLEACYLGKMWFEESRVLSFHLVEILR